MATVEMDEASKQHRKRRSWTRVERRRIVEETLKPGASVSLVARAHDVNANQVFKWRREYQKGQLQVAQPSTLLPVKVSAAVDAVPSESNGKSRGNQPGIIDIDLGHARIRIEGAADPDCVRAALEGLVE